MLFSCCIRLFDKNNDGKVSWAEIKKKFGNGITRAVHVANQILPMANAFVVALQVNGAISADEAKRVLDMLEKVALTNTIVGEAAKRIGRIGIPKSLKQIGDWNGDGVINQADAIQFCDEALRLINNLIDLGVDQKSLSNFRTAVSSARDIIATSNNNTITITQAYVKTFAPTLPVSTTASPTALTRLSSFAIPPANSEITPAEPTSLSSVA